VQEEEQIAIKYVSKKTEELNEQIEKLRQENERVKRARVKYEEQMK
jgi:hypothetical protein